MKSLTKIYLTTMGIFASIVCLAMAPASAQTFQNGNFGGSGTPTLSHWTVSYSAANSLTTSYNESLDGNNDYANAHFNTGGAPAGTVLSQTFNDYSGTYYTVSYLFGNYTATALSSSQDLTAVIDGIPVQFTTIAGTKNSINSQLLTFTFLGTGVDTLSFSDAGSSGIASSDGILENVNIAPTPEAATWIGSALGLLLMLGLSIRSRKSTTFNNIG